MRIDLAGWSREATAGDPRAFLALFETAERLGFDGVWFHEFRLLPDAGPYPSPLLLAAALLARTERLRVGTSALVLPLHRPLLLAEELAQLAHQSGGRIDAGVGRGTDPQTLWTLGIDPAETRARFEDGCIALRAHAPRVPLYVAGASPETLGFAIERDLPLLLSLEPPETAQLGHVASLLQGRPSTLLARSSLARHVCIAPTAAEATARLDSLWAKLQARRVFFAARRGVPAAQVPPLDPGRMLHEQFIHGDPAQCHAQIVALRRRSGIDALRCVFNANGLLDDAQALAGMALFSREVLDALRAPA
jgi:alkanesulfonate monooxygenase SsuD/methylene tetrahydromethanopterin reductase-like flavin-dependent oxidoreductase (luciferase family)